MGKVKVVTTEESYIRSLPFSAFRELFKLLDPGKEWEKLAVFIPKRLDMTDEDFEPRYSYQAIILYANRGNKPNGSATEALLADWATQNARIKHLIAALVKAKLYAAADYLSVKILNKEPVPRPSVTQEVNSNGLNNLGTDIDLPFPLTGGGQLLKPYQRHPSSQPEEHKEEGYDEQDSRTEVIDRMESAAGSVEAQHLFYESSKISEGVMAECDMVEIQKIEQASESIESMLTSSKVFIQNMKYGMLKMITNGFDETDLAQKGRLIGRGGFGTVFLGKFKNGFQIAVKCLKDDDKTMDIDKQFENELRCLSEYRHINLVHLLGFSNDGPCKCIIYQYISNGSLEDRIMCKDNTPPLPAWVRVTVAEGTAEGIAFLNARDMVHRDIKSANVLLDSDFVPKVADFATVRSAPKGSGVSAVQSTSVVIGTSAYLAPEAIQGDVSTKLDSFSFGVVLLELLTGLQAFDNEREEKDIKSYMDDNCEDIFKMLDPSAGEWDEKAVIKLYDVASRCVEHKKKKRPTVGDVLGDLRSLSDSLKSGD
ncbi:interleukin-1 receptor-associated kinase 4 [Patella vulgata]|uniref:interleukin-1 receptor-associated kinase 4 n=1 Tax=Patella vulgata TaxID=6465 RepID=UPI00217FF0F2|nr:interleukin-1 receptor-associated kinase 4 [Patella vulgata]